MHIPPPLPPGSAPGPHAAQRAAYLPSPHTHRLLEEAKTCYQQTKTPPKINPQPEDQLWSDVVRDQKAHQNLCTERDVQPRFLSRDERGHFVRTDFFRRLRRRGTGTVPKDDAQSPVGTLDFLLAPLEPSQDWDVVPACQRGGPRGTGVGGASFLFIIIDVQHLCILITVCFIWTFLLFIFC